MQKYCQGGNVQLFTDWSSLTWILQRSDQQGPNPSAAATTALDRANTYSAFSKWTAEWQCVCQKGPELCWWRGKSLHPPAPPFLNQPPGTKDWQTDAHQGTNAALIQMHLKAEAVLWVKAPVLSQRVWRRQWQMTDRYTVPVNYCGCPPCKPIACGQFSLFSFILFCSIVLCVPMSLLSQIREFCFSAPFGTLNKPHSTYSFSG